MDQFNLFEPDLELGRSLIPYEDQEIQGVWPRKQRQPSDVFPTNAALIGRGPNRDARWLRANKDGILLTDDINGGGSNAPKPIYTESLDYGISGEGSVRAQNFPVDVTAIYAVLCTWDVQNEDTVPGSGWVDFCLQGASAGNLFTYYRGSCSVLVPGAFHGKSESKYIPFNPPLDPVAMGWTGSNGPIQMVIINNTTQQLDAAMLVYHN